MRLLFLFAMLCALAAAGLSGGAALAQIRSAEVSFPADNDELVLQGDLRGREILVYQVPAVEGRKLAVGLETTNAANHFNITEPGAAEAAFVGSRDGNYAEVLLDKPGGYEISLYLLSAAARRDEVADFRLSLTLLPAGDFADSLSGGPDYWEVTDVNSRLRLRAGPSAGHGVIGALDNGEVVRNLGCRLAGDERWCRIEALGGGGQGWVAGRYLREGATPERLGAEGDGQRFDLTGQLPCSPVPGQPTTSCTFGVIREDRPGHAGLWIDIGGESERYFLFEDGEPVHSNGAGEITVERLGDLQLLRLGGERYEIPDAVIYGG